MNTIKNHGNTGSQKGNDSSPVTVPKDMEHCSNLEFKVRGQNATSSKKTQKGNSMNLGIKLMNIKKYFAKEIEILKKN